MKYLIPAMLTLAIIAFSCAGGSDSSSSSSTNSPATPKKEIAEKTPSAGEKVYNTHCAVCHLPTGKGMPAMYPPLIETKWVSGDKSTLINVVLQGLKGEIEVKGETYNQVMTPYASILSDQEIAEVLTYVRSSFGNDYPAVTPAEVKAERDKL